MAGKELKMKIIDEILRLKSMGKSKRQISKILGIHRNTVSKYFENESNNIIKEEIKNSFCGIESWVEKIEWEKIREEVLQGVPIQIIHEELREKGKLEVLYPAFWKQLRKRMSLSKATMVRVFEPGSRCEIDYCDGINIIDVVTGEVLRTNFFVGVLCSSRYTFAEFTFSQKSEDFYILMLRCLNFLEVVLR
ncbi:MAG: helix-turn-helix domain-containing protein [Bdellovibrionales bacterium]|nr:helix-turn-helix domain-containing protein [Bdellovibrionales bacterium]